MDAEAVAEETIERIKGIWAELVDDIKDDVLQVLDNAQEALALTLLEPDPLMQEELLAEISDAQRTLLEAQEEHLQQSQLKGLHVVMDGVFALTTKLLTQ